MTDLEKVNTKFDKLQHHFRNWTIFMNDAHVCDEDELKKLSDKAEVLLREFEDFKA